MKTGTWDRVAYLLVLAGGLNWGLIGIFKYNLIGELFGFTTGLTRLIYAAVGVAAAYLTYNWFTARSKKK